MRKSDEHSVTDSGNDLHKGLYGRNLDPFQAKRYRIVEGSNDFVVNVGNNESDVASKLGSKDVDVILVVCSILAENMLQLRNLAKASLVFAINKDNSRPNVLFSFLP